MSPIANSFGPYRLIQRLGAREWGDTHLAKRVGTGGFEKRVVILRVAASSAEGAYHADVVAHEAKRGAALSHANIAQVLDVGALDGDLFIATEHVPGRSLRDVLRVHRTLDWGMAAHIAAEVAAALRYAHGRRTASGELLRLVHRRLTPARIMLSSGGVKVIGFGVSWAWPPIADYRSPEEATGEPVDGRADVFAVGAILRRCLPATGAPRPLLEVIEWAMQPYPEHRPNATELERALVEVLHDGDLLITPRDVATLTMEPAPQTADVGEASVFDTIERIEATLDAWKTDSVASSHAALDLYEQLGRLCEEARAGARGAPQMMRALVLADGLGRDDYVARFCALRGRLLAQDKRTDQESLDWLERATMLRG